MNVKLFQQIQERTGWKIAKTETHIYVTEQIKICKKHGISGILCEQKDIGKTTAGLVFAMENDNSFYIDGSQAKSKQRLIRLIAKEVGAQYEGRYSDVYDALVDRLLMLKKPVIIIDEFGDISHEAFMEIKALWNATQYACGWYAIGAETLQLKIERAIQSKRPGYVETYSRFGDACQKVKTKKGNEDAEVNTMLQAAQVIRLNAPKADVQKMLAKSNNSLRKVFHEITKID